MVRKYLPGLLFMGAMATADTALTMKTFSDYRTEYSDGAHVEGNPVVRYSIDKLGVHRGLVAPKFGAMALALGGAVLLDKKYRKKGPLVLYLGGLVFLGGAVLNAKHPEYMDLHLDQYVSKVWEKTKDLF